MLHLNRFTSDIFDLPRLSDKNLRTFANDHLIRLANNNPGAIYNPLISATTTTYTAFNDSLISESVKKAVAKGHVLASKAAMTAMKTQLRKQHALITYIFGEESGTYQEFFPHGLNAYHRAQLDQLKPMLNAYLKAAETHLLADHPTDVAAIGTVITAYIDARNAHHIAQSEKNKAATARRANRKALTKQLTRNFLIIASDNVDNPDRFDNLYDPKLLPLGKGVR